MLVSDDDGEWNYRRRARIAVKDVEKKGRVLVGFREKFAPFVVDMNNCEILSPPVNNLIKPLSNLIESLSIRREMKGIVVGKDGSTLKKIGTSARLDLKNYFKKNIHLNLWVKVKSNWADSKKELISMGFEI